MLDDTAIADCAERVYGSWGWCLYKDDTRNPKALVAWLFGQCATLVPDPASLFMYQLPKSDQKDIFANASARLEISRDRPQLISFIPAILIYFLVDFIVQLIIHYWLTASGYVLKQA
jgi:hypothetical protein